MAKVKIGSLYVSLSAGTARIAKDFKKANSIVAKFKRKTNKAMKSVAKSMFSFKGAIAILAGTAGLGLLINKHKEFTAAISDLAAITGATGKDLDFYKEQALAVGEATTLSATQAATAFKLIASAKPDLLESKEALASVTFEAVKLAEAASIDMPQAAVALGSALNQFSAGAEEASRFINVLAAGAKFGASEIEDTSEALKTAGLVASAAGSSFEETNAAIQAMSTVALKGSEAGTGLRNVYLNLTKQSKDKFKPELVGLTQALKNLQAENLSTNELLDIFGKKNIVAARALIQNADQVGILTGKLTGTNTAYEQAAIKVDNLKGDQLKMNSAWESATLLLGDMFDPALRAITQSITWLSKPVKHLLLLINDLGNEIGAYAAIAANVLTLDFDGVSAIIAARREEVAEVKKKIALIYAEKKAIDALKESTGGKPSDIAPISKNDGDAQIIKTGFEYTDPSPQLASQIDALQQSLLTEEQRILESYDRRSFMVEEAFQNQVISEQYKNELLAGLAAQHESKKSAIAKKGEADRQRVFAAGLGAASNIFANLGALMGKEGKKQNAAQKIMAKAAIIASTAQAIMNALAVPPYPLGLSLAAGAALQGAKQLRQVGGGGSVSAPVASPANQEQQSLPIPTSPAGSNVSQFPHEIHVTVDVTGDLSPDQADRLAESLARNMQNGGKSPVAA